MVDKIKFEYVVTLLDEFAKYAKNNHFDLCHQCCIFACLIKNSSIYDKGNINEIDTIINKVWINFSNNQYENFLKYTTINIECVSKVKKIKC